MKAPIPNVFGTWKANSVQGNSPNPTPMPRNMITVFSPDEDGIHYVADAVFSDGRDTHVECSFRLDGQSYSIKGSLLGDQISAEMLDANSFRATIRREGALSAQLRVTTRDQGRVLVMDWDIVPDTGPTMSFSTLADRVD